MYESTDKMVSHPGHYQSKNGLETIQVIEAFTEGLEGIEATDTGNIIKYVCRWKQKNGIQDLEKILWYTQHLIDHLKKKEAKQALNNIYGTNSQLQEQGKKFLAECYAEKEKKLLSDLTDEEKQELHETLRNSDVSILFDALAAACGLSKIAEEVKKKCPEHFKMEDSNGSSSN